MSYSSVLRGDHHRRVMSGSTAVDRGMPRLVKVKKRLGVGCLACVFYSTKEKSSVAQVSRRSGEMEHVNKT
jgi:hypothetical protein